MPLLLPFFKFDVQAWLTSETVSLMNNEQRGAFVQLLAKCWACLSCTLPNDREQVQVMAEWKGSAEQFDRVFSCFIPVKKTPDRVFNVRLMKEWKEAKLKQTFYADRAKVGADARWATKPVKTKRKTGERPTTDWVTALRENPLYSHVDFDKELAQIQRWKLIPKNRHRQITERFVITWLNRIDRPLVLTPKPRTVQL